VIDKFLREHPEAYRERLNTLYIEKFLDQKTRVETVRRLDLYKLDQKDPTELKMLQEVKDFVNRFNQYAWVPVKIDDDDLSQWKYLSELIMRSQNSPLWSHLFNDRSAEKYFERPLVDPSEPVLFVDAQFLMAHAGNPLVDYKVKHVADKLKSGERMEVPFYEMRNNKVGEGNHRIAAMKQLGISAVPVHIFWIT
jgi:hypothetical protein